jgi:hypothetical protein
MPTMKFLEFRLSGFESAIKPRAPVDPPASLVAE